MPAGGKGRRLVAVAEVARPHGVRGELRLKLYNEGSDLLASRPPIRLRLPDGSEREASIQTARPADKALLVTLSGVPDRDAAEAVRGAKVLVERDRFPALDPGEFYACDVEGARAVTAAGDDVGVVTELRSYPTCDVLVIERPGAGALEVPLVEAYVASIDVDGGRVVQHTVEGLCPRPRCAPT